MRIYVVIVCILLSGCAEGRRVVDNCAKKGGVIIYSRGPLAMDMVCIRKDAVIDATNQVP